MSANGSPPSTPPPPTPAPSTPPPPASAPAVRTPHGRVSSAGRSVLVVGSYPPAPTAGSAVAIEVVRRLWDEGATPHAASPRAGAAPLTAPVTGLLAGRRLDNLRTITNAGDVVVCVERDLPIPTGGVPRPLLGLWQRICADRVVKALARFDHVTLIACGDTGLPAGVWARLIFAADTVTDRSEVRGTPGVTTLGPSETTAAEVIRKAWRFAAPRLFGRRAPAVTRLVAGSARAGLRLARRRPVEG